MILVDPRFKELFDQMPGAWGCKNNNSEFIYANEEYARIIGVKNKEEIPGMTDFDMPCETVNCASLFREQDKSVMETGKRMKILDIHPFARHEWKAYIFTKTPLLDDNKNIIGTIFHGLDVTETYLLDIGCLLSKFAIQGVKEDLLGQNSFMLSHDFKELKLTVRESECLFYLLRGKTVKQIAIVLKISSRTVEEYCEKLRVKFRALNKNELIEKAIEKGYLNTIPATLFNKQLSITLRED